MNEKREVAIFAFFIMAILAISFAVALNNTEDTTNDETKVINLTGFDSSYSCLKNQINTLGVANLSDEQLAFSLLALGYDSNLKGKIRDELENRKSANSCWPKNGCQTKLTAQIIMAYDHIGKDTKKSEAWLYNQSKADSDLIWYLEIDTEGAAKCQITYDSNKRNVNINDDKTLSSSAGSCFNLTKNNYWLQISPNCYGKEFRISCDKDFLTTLVYKTKSQEEYYVSTKTNTASVNGETIEKVSSYCFKEGSSCSYESSLWATLVLQMKDNETEGYIPYLTAMASSNEKYMPYSFLYALTGLDEVYSSLVSVQKTQGFWQESTQSKRYYDTALGLMALYGKSSEAFDKAVNYLLTPSVLGKGCWNGNNIADTALILYAAYPKAASGEGGGTTSLCQDFSSYSCSSTTECSRRNGTELPNFRCYGGLICCDKSISLSSCSSLGGVLCSSDETCKDGQIKQSSDSRICCVDGTCVPSTNEESTCVDSGGKCRTQCLTTEERDSVNTCDEGICCVEGDIEEKNYWWLWLLIILIILLALAILFRNQLKIWIFRIKGGFSKSPVEGSNRPSFPPQPQQGMNMPRRIMPQGMQRPPLRQPMQQGRPFPKDRELDATLKKIKEIGS